MSSDYRKHIQSVLANNPELQPLLQKVTNAYYKAQRTVPQQITLGDFVDSDMFKLAQLFTPNAIRRRGRKLLFFPAKMNLAGIEVEPWFKAANSLTAKPKTANIALEVELLNKLALLFSDCEPALELLSNKPSIIKRKITEMGNDRAFAHYNLCFQAIRFLKQNDKLLTPSDLGVKLCEDSKAFRKGTTLNYNTAELVAAELNCQPDVAFEKCGITDNQTAITVTVFGPFSYYRQGKRFDWIKQLWEQGEAAMLNMGNLEHIDYIELAKDCSSSVLSCENESPFNHLMRDECKRALIYTAGFPNSAVKKFIKLLDDKIKLLHWGDTDPEGLEIAASLDQVKSLQLYRCGAGEIEKLQHCLIPLSKGKIKRARKLLESPNFRFHEALKLTLNCNGWLEQESWQP